MLGRSPYKAVADLYTQAYLESKRLRDIEEAKASKEQDTPKTVAPKARMNINDYVYVRLTPAGEELWAEEWNRWSDNKGKVPWPIEREARQSDGRVRFQFHELMHIFGPSCFNGSSELPFEKNEVEFD